MADHDKPKSEADVGTGNMLARVFRTFRQHTLITGTVGGLAAISILFLVLHLLGLRLDWNHDRRPKDTFGQIIVESPEVYTRERLVNDRLGQEVWLRKQMKATERVHGEGDFRSVEGDLWRDAETLMTWRMEGMPKTRKAEESDDANDTGGDNNSNHTPGSSKDYFSEKGHPKGSSIELFRAMNEYREHVRTELMQTGLDDRHDIDGNTLYRLNFNTTVVHGRSSDALAVIRVSLQHGEEIGDARNSYYDDLLHKWSRELERAINEVAEDRMPAMLQEPNTNRNHTELYMWFRWKICTSMKRIAISEDFHRLIHELDALKTNATMSDANDGDDAPETIYATKRFAKSNCGEKYYENSSYDFKDDDIRQKTEENLDWFIGDYVKRYRESKPKQDWFSNYLAVRTQLLEVYKAEKEKGKSGYRKILSDPLAYYRHLVTKFCGGFSTQARRMDNTSSGIGAGSGGTTESVDSKEREGTTSRIDAGLAIPEAKLFGGQCAYMQSPTARIAPVEGVMDLYWHVERIEQMLHQTNGVTKKVEVLKSRSRGGGVRFDEVSCDMTAVEHAKQIIRRDNSEEEEAVRKLFDTETGLVCKIEPRSLRWIRNLGIQQHADQFHRDFIDSPDASGGAGTLRGIVETEVVGWRLACAGLPLRRPVRTEGAAGVR